MTEKWTLTAILMLSSFQNSITDGLDRLTDIFNVMMHAGDTDAV